MDNSYENIVNTKLEGSKKDIEMEMNNIATEAKMSTKELKEVEKLELEIGELKCKKKNSNKFKDWISTWSTLLGLLIPGLIFVFNNQQNAKDAKKLIVDANVLKLADSLNKELKIMDDIVALSSEIDPYLEIQLMALNEKILPYLIQQYVNQDITTKNYNNEILETKKSFIKNAIRIIAFEGVKVSEFIDERLSKYLETKGSNKNKVFKNYEELKYEFDKEFNFYKYRKKISSNIDTIQYKNIK